MTELLDQDLDRELEKRVWQGNAQTLDRLPPGNPHGWAGTVQAQLRTFGQAPDLSSRPARHAPLPSLAALTLVKDEADVIGLNLEWLHSLGVRRFVIIDNGSTDETLGAISRFAVRHREDAEVEVLVDTTLAYLQAAKMTSACRHAIERWPDLAWLLPFDADEFVQARHGLQALLSVPAHVEAVTVLRVIHFRPVGAADPDGLGWRDLAAMSVRSGAFAVPPKVFLRATGRLDLGKGNHWAQPTAGESVRYEGGLAYGLFIREFQTRSFAQFHSKVRNGGPAIRAAQALGYGTGGEHWLAWEAILQQGGQQALREEYEKVAFRRPEGDYAEDRFEGLDAIEDGQA